MLRIAATAALALVLACCGVRHEPIEGKYTNAAWYRAATATLDLANGINRQCGAFSCSDGRYKFCRDSDHCEAGAYHTERREPYGALDAIWFDGPVMTKAYGDGGWIDYDVWGEPMIGFDDPDSGAEFVRSGIAAGFKPAFPNPLP